MSSAKGKGVCPKCGKEFQLEKGVLPYHDFPVPARAVCPGSKSPPVVK
jgi:hypothetical protein